MSPDDSFDFETCPDCNGSGEGSHEGIGCATCGGEGEVLCEATDEDSEEQEILEAVDLIVESSAHVHCSACKETHLVKEVIFLGIEEDFFGKDLLSFQCVKTQSQQQSNVWMR